MKYLLDTHVLIWFLTDSRQKLSNKTIALFHDTSVELYFSTASIWEMSIKSALGKPDFQYDPHEVVDELLKQNFNELNISREHVLAVSDLPRIHGDPFDRLLIVQSDIENMKLLTADAYILQYDFSQIIKV